MTDEAKLPTVATRETADVHVFARNPSEMEDAQTSLIQWCDSRLAQERASLAEAEENLAVAKKAKWRSAPWQRVVNLSKRKVAFYEKMQRALCAGYYIVPDFPVDVFAIRTKAQAPKKQVGHSAWDQKLQSAQVLPAGEGRYVSDQPEIWQESYEARDKEGNPVTERVYWAEDFQDVDFPLRLVKPEILDQTAAAMAMKVFDEIGVLPAGRKGDPIVIGRIYPPHRKDSPVAFFIGWWLDTSEL